MISIVHYISAKRRLKESQKTVMMLGGRDECPPMVLAQTDMIELEMKYYREEMEDLLIKSLLVTVFVIGCGLMYVAFGSLKGNH